MKRTNSLRQLVAVWSTLLVAGCSPDMRRPEPVSAVSSAETPSVGNIPYPVKFNDSTAVTDASGDEVPSWDGTVVDLLAADAWAQCAANTQFGSDAALDNYLSYLQGKMASAACPSSQTPAVSNLTIRDCTASSCARVKLWAKQRQTAACNVNTSTKQSATVEFLSNGRMGTDYAVPATSAFTGVNATNSMYKAYAVAHTQFQVDVAEVNLCMAQRLREYMASADSLVLRGEDQRELLEVTRERAQIAMLQYALIGRALATHDPQLGSKTVTSQRQVLPFFDAWGSMSDQEDALTAMGDDFAASVQLHIEATQELAELLARSASARLPRGGAASGRAQEDWGGGSWRQRLLGLMYGTNPLLTSSGEVDIAAIASGDVSIDALAVQVQPAPWTLVWDLPAMWPTGGLPIFTTRQPYVHQLAPEPEVGVLLALARAADALVFKEQELSVDALGSYPIRGVDVDSTYPILYLLVEAYLQRQACLASGGSECTFVVGQDPAENAIDAYEGTLLWREYKISPAHAKTLVAVLSDAIPQFAVPAYVMPSAALATDLSETEGALRITGHHEIFEDGVPAERVQGVLAAGGRWYHVDPTFALAEDGIVDRAPAYSETKQFWMPTSFKEWNVDKPQGFQPDGQRGMGAMSALSATRDLVEAARGDATTNGASIANTFLSVAPRVTELINAAVGTTAVSVRPQPSERQLIGDCDDWKISSANVDVDGCSKLVQASSFDGRIGGTVLHWYVDVTTAGDDTMFSGTAPTVIAVPAGGLEATAARDANFRSFSGKTQADWLASSSTVVASTPTTTTLPSGLVTRRYVLEVPFGGSFDFTKRWWTLMVRSRASGAGYTYQVLARNVAFTASTVSLLTDANASPEDVPLPSDGQYFPYGGSFGDKVAQAWATVPIDWAKPAVDGFGLPTDWVPTTDPSLTGAQSGNDSVSYYLSTARSAADEATNAVKDAIDEMLKEQGDSNATAVAQKQASGISDLEQQAMCGDANVQCDTGTATLNLGTYLPPTCGETKLCGALAFSVLELLLAKPTITVATPVYLARDATTAPEFAEYSGGTLQKLLIDEWSAVRRIYDAVKDASAAAEGKSAEIIAADAEVIGADDAVSEECSSDAFERAFKAGMSYDDGDSAHHDGTAWGVEYKSKTWSPGPMQQQYEACQTAQRSVVPTRAREAAVIADAWAWLSAQATLLGETTSALQSATATATAALHNTEIAKARAQLEAKLAADGLQTKFGTARRYHSYDVWRARALLDSARRYALTARKAVEARYVLDLSVMKADEAFVAAPAMWADEIYEYDLDAPSAVGLTHVAQQAGGIYPNRISDYVGNLERLVQGYAVNRPTAVARRDVEIIALPGPNVAADPSLSLPTGAADAQSAGWEFRCDKSSPWFPNPNFGDVGASDALSVACPVPGASSGGGAPPSGARLMFSLDPWGRVNGSIASAPVENRHNARWVRLALNLVGTGVKNCERAQDPAGCYSEAFVRYSLRHEGHPWVTDYLERWRTLGVPVGLIEGGKALAAEEWLDPVANAWGKPYVEAVARSEFDERPLGGVYTLELQLGPEVDLRKIERLQILAEMDYWVKQN